MSVRRLMAVAKGKASAGANRFGGAAAPLASSRLGGIAVILLLAAPARATNPTTAPTVGMEGRSEVTLPGTPLEAKPVDEKSPLVLRIASTQPAAGGTKYDLRYIGLVPGSYDLRKYLLRSDGSPTGDLPEVPVTVAGLLPEDHQGQLVPPSTKPLSALAWYKAAMIALGVLWLLLLVPLILIGRKRKAVRVIPVARPPSMADRLRPLVEQAARGELSTDGKGQLERMLLGFWRHRLALHDLTMADAVARLKAHPQAGALLRALEDWLHRPPGSASVDVAGVLAPYLDVPAEQDFIPPGADALPAVVARV
jgi:hypothetical protein